MHVQKNCVRCNFCGLSYLGSPFSDVGVAVFSSALVVGLRERVDSIHNRVGRGSTLYLQTQNAQLS